MKMGWIIKTACMCTTASPSITTQQKDGDFNPSHPSQTLQEIIYNKWDLIKTQDTTLRSICIVWKFMMVTFQHISVDVEGRESSSWTLGWARRVLVKPALQVRTLQKHRVFWIDLTSHWIILILRWKVERCWFNSKCLQQSLSGKRQKPVKVRSYTWLQECRMCVNVCVWKGSLALRPIRLLCLVSDQGSHTFLWENVLSVGWPFCGLDKLFCWSHVCQDAF